MPQCCAVPFCSEKKGGHKFPRDKTVSKQWLVAIRRVNYTPSIHSRVCKKHFKPDDYELPKESNTENPTPRLKPKVIPSIFSWNHESAEGKEIKRKLAERALKCQKKRKTAKLCLKTEKNQCKEYFTCEEQYIEIDIENSKKDVAVQCNLCNCEERKKEGKKYIYFTTNTNTNTKTKFERKLKREIE